MEQLNVTVYKTETHIIITGIPEEEDETAEESRHNCDAMGCGQEHVLYRFKIVENRRTKEAKNEH